MKTLIHHSSMISNESNVVDVATLAFLPFTFYCNSTVHIKNERYVNKEIKCLFIAWLKFDIVDR